MTIVKEILQQMPALSKPQRKFLETLFVTILALRGRVNFRNLSRYCDYSERTIARPFRHAFNWPAFHQQVLTTVLSPSAEVVSAQDASFIPKSGKQTFGLGHFCNGCATALSAGWRFPPSPWWRSRAAALSPSPSHRGRRRRTPGRQNRKKPGLISTTSNYVSSGTACRRPQDAAVGNTIMDSDGGFQISGESTKTNAHTQ